MTCGVSCTDNNFLLLSTFVIETAGYRNNSSAPAALGLQVRKYTQQLGNHSTVECAAGNLYY